MAPTKYRKLEPYVVEQDTPPIQTQVRGFHVKIDASPGERPWAELGPSGVLVVREGYTWDGASGPAIDTSSVMDASLAHDVLYEFIARGLLPWSTRKAADKTLLRLCQEAKMPGWRSQYIYWAVRLFGGFAIDWVRQLFPAKRKFTPAGKLAAAFAVALVLAGCGGRPPVPPLPPSDEAAYQACMRAAYQRADEEGDRLCPPDKVQWLECEHHAAIEAQQKTDQEACRE
jgi:hypothetical protein